MRNVVPSESKMLLLMKHTRGVTLDNGQDSVCQLNQPADQQAIQSNLIKCVIFLSNFYTLIHCRKERLSDHQWVGRVATAIQAQSFDQVDNNDDDDWQNETMAHDFHYIYEY